MKTMKQTPLNARAIRYMASSMAMAKPTEHQGENWVLGHLVAFAAAELRCWAPSLGQLRPGDRFAIHAGRMVSPIEIREAFQAMREMGAIDDDAVLPTCRPMCSRRCGRNSPRARSTPDETSQRKEPTDHDHEDPDDTRRTTAAHDARSGDPRRWTDADVHARRPKARHVLGPRLQGELGGQVPLRFAQRQRPLREGRLRRTHACWWRRRRMLSASREDVGAAEAMTADERRVRHLLYMRRWYAKFYRRCRETGMCTRGCGEPAEPGRATCSACRQYRKEQRAAR